MSNYLSTPSNEAPMKSIVDKLTMKENGQIVDAASAVSVADSLLESFKANFKPKKIGDSDTIAVGGMYLSQQLQEILPRILTQVYPNMPILRIMAVDNSGALMQSIIQRAQSFSGNYRAKHETANTSGTVSINRTAREQRVFEYEGSTEYSHTDLERSIRLEENIDSAIIEAHQWAYQTKLDEIAFKGITLQEGADPVTEGLTNYSSFVPANYKTASGAFSTLDGLAIYNNIKELYNEMIGQAGGSEELRPNKIVLPPAQYSIIASTALTGSSGAASNIAPNETVLSYIQKVLGLTAYPAARCVGASDSGTDLLIMLSATPDNMRLFIPKPLSFFPVYNKLSKYVLGGTFRVAGVGINRNNAIGYLKSI